MVELFCPASDFASQGTDSSTVHGSIEPPDFDLASEFHGVSLQSPRPLPELLFFVMRMQPLSVVVAKPKTPRDVVVYQIHAGFMDYTLQPMIYLLRHLA